MKKHNIDIVTVSYKTPELIEIMIRSFQKFVTEDFNLNFIIIENSNFDLGNELKKKSFKDITVINNPINMNFSYAHGNGLELAKEHLSQEAKYVFTCHSDVCVVNQSFFEEIKMCIEEDVYLAGVCEDSHAGRIRALHCSGLLVRSELYKKVSLMPDLPKIDTADLLTVHCRDNGLKMKLFKNTYNDQNLVDLCNSPFRELGKNCGVDRCLDSKNDVMFIHQGRGTSKYSNEYSSPHKIMTNQWIDICEKIIQQ
jgi:hypothetical protein